MSTSIPTLSSALALLPIFLLAASAQTVVVTVGPTIPTAAPEFVQPALFTSAILNSTNTYRAQSNASAVAWNDTLSDYAASYLDSTCDFEHSGGPYGENLALGCSNATSCVEAWGNERDGYDFKGEFTEDAGHFTQLVWKNTTDVGCGAKLCGDSGWYLVCEYWPRGNVIGEFDEEVQRESVGSIVSLRPTVLVSAVAMFVFLALV
jgi:hypothetical protein